MTFFDYEKATWAMVDSNEQEIWYLNEQGTMRNWIKYIIKIYILDVIMVQRANHPDICYNNKNGPSYNKFQIFTGQEREKVRKFKNNEQKRITIA